MKTWLPWRAAFLAPIICLFAWSGILNDARAQDSFLDALDGASSVNLLSNGGFEAATPALWTPTGGGAVWTTERSRTPSYALKLSGSGAASWQQAEAVQHWVSRILGNLEIIVGGWVYTEGVNTSPAGDAQKFQLVFEFFNAGGTDLLDGPLVIDLPQAAAGSGGWVKIDNTSLGALVLPENATSAKITFRKGADATGSAFLDDVFIRKADAGADGWPGGFFNTNMDIGANWYYWWNDFDQGVDSWPASQHFTHTLSTDAARTGSKGLLMRRNPGADSEVVTISERVPVVAGEPMVVSFWVRHANVPSPETIGEDNNNIGITVLWYENMEAGAAGYGELGGLDIRLNGDYNDQVIPLATRIADSGWKQYAFVVYPRTGAIGMETRLRYWHGFEGTTHWDDVFVAPVSNVLAEVPNLLRGGDFEATRPALWTPLVPMATAGADWSSDRSRSPGYSLKLWGTGAAEWKQQEAVRHWVARILGNLEIEVGGWVYTEGVNTNPATDAEKFQLVFEFFNSAGANLLDGELAIDLPQATATTDGWVKIDNTSLGALVLPENATSATITFRKGLAATGAAYLDDVFLRKADPQADGWPGGFFNTNMDIGSGWYYWWPDFDQGLDSWPESLKFTHTVSADAARTGSRGLVMERLLTHTDEIVTISERVPVTPGEPMMVSFWMRHLNVPAPETIGENNNNVGLTVLWYDNMTGGKDGYGEIGGADIRLNGEYNDQVIPLAPRVADSGWKHYSFVVYPRTGAVGMETRLRYWHGFEGVTHWDDVHIVNIGGQALTGTSIADGPDEDRSLPGGLMLQANYPNPFNPATTIRFVLPDAMDVTLDVFNLLGQRVASLVESRFLSAGTHEVVFEAENLPSGLYLYRLRSRAGTETRTMMLVK
jgi:hypothetical protein